jgi:type I restriction enzyme S subunit
MRWAVSDLPANWTSTQLGEVCKVVRGITFPASAKEEKLTSKNVCCLRTTNVQKEVDWDDVYFVSKEYVKRDEQFVKIGDVLMSMANSYELVGKVSVVRELPYLSSFGAFLSAVRPLPVIDAQYLFHLLRTAKVQSELRKGSSQTVNIANISVGRLSEIEIPLAPLDEQKRIAEKLDTLFARVDSCQTHLERVPQILKRFRQSVLAAATSGRLTEDWREERAVNGEWETCTIGDVLADIKYGTAKKSIYELKNGIPVLRIPNIKDGKIDATDLKFSHFDKKEIESLSLKTGDLLLIRSNGSVDLVGKVAIVDSKFEGFMYAGYLIRLRFDTTKVNPLYISFYLSSPAIRSHIELTARSTSGVNNINSEEVKAISLELPPLEEQAEIVRRVEKLFAYAERLEARYTSASEHVERLTPSLLAKAFRGELVRQE